jgi:hypothetical protein
LPPSINHFSSFYFGYLPNFGCGEEELMKCFVRLPVNDAKWATRRRRGRRPSQQGDPPSNVAGNAVSKELCRPLSAPGNSLRGSTRRIGRESPRWRGWRTQCASVDLEARSRGSATIAGRLRSRRRPGRHPTRVGHYSGPESAPAAAGDECRNPAGDWTDNAFGLGKWAKNLAKPASPQSPKGTGPTMPSRLGRALRRGYRNLGL